MAKLRNAVLIISLLAFALLSALVYAQQEKVNIFKGNVTTGGAYAANGAVVEAFIGSSSSAIETYTLGSPNFFPASNYSVDFSCDAGSTAFLKVWGINATHQTCTDFLVNFTNLSVSLVANDGACSYANACSGGFCCSSTNAAVNQSAGSGACQSVACGIGITVPGFSLNESAITGEKTVNLTVNISSVLRHNITAANFSLITPTGVINRNFTIPSNGKNFNISYQIFSANELTTAGTYNVSAVMVTDNGSVNNLTTITTLNFTVTSTGITVPGFSLSAASITTTQTVNFTVNISSVLRHNITAANFSLVTPSGNISRNFTIPSNGKNFNLSYKIFNSAETATAGTYNVTAVMVTDNGSITNVTAITNMNFTVTAAAANPTPDTGGGGSSGGGGGGGGKAASTPATAPSQETVETVKDALPATFQVAADAGNVEYNFIAAPELKAVSAKAESATSDIKYAVDYLVKTEKAQQELSSIQQAVSAGGATTVQATGGTVKKTIEVVKATNKATKEEVTVSVVKLVVTAPSNKDLKNVEVIEVIPKAAASNVNQVTFKGEKPIVLEADPVVKWFFSEVKKGQNKDLSYAISKDIRNISTSTIAVQGRAEAATAIPPAPEAPSTPSGGEKPGEAKKPTPVSSIFVVVIAAVVIVGGWFMFKRRKPQK